MPVDFIKPKTVKVISAITVGGLQPGQIAEVEDGQQTRNLIEAGFWTMLVESGTAAAAAVIAAPVDTSVPLATETPVTETVSSKSLFSRG